MTESVPAQPRILRELPKQTIYNAYHAYTVLINDTTADDAKRAEKKWTKKRDDKYYTPSKKDEIMIAAWGNAMNLARQEDLKWKEAMCKFRYTYKEDFAIHDARRLAAIAAGTWAPGQIH